MEINDNDILTYDTLIKLYEKNENNEFLKYLIDNKIIDGINYSGYKKIVEFISKKEFSSAFYSHEEYILVWLVLSNKSYFDFQNEIESDWHSSFDLSEIM